MGVFRLQDGGKLNKQTLSKTLPIPPKSLIFKVVQNWSQTKIQNYGNVLLQLVKVLKFL
jgi:hypothetical protein